MKRIALVAPAGKVSEMSVSGEPAFRAFVEELSRLGYVEGQNLGVERYSGEGRTERYPQLGRDVVNTRPESLQRRKPRLGNARPCRSLELVRRLACAAINCIVRRVEPSRSHPWSCGICDHVLNAAILPRPY
jgi:hypothetical protein